MYDYSDGMDAAMDPELAAVLAGWTPVRFEDPAAQRAAIAEALATAPAPLLPPGVVIESRTVPRGDGSELGLRIYRPASPARGTLLWFHGGAYCIGSVQQEDPMCAELSTRTDTVVVSVDYRLAPEHPYPAALDDCRLAIDWVADGGAEHDVASILAVGGTSAGAGLAAAGALRCRDEAGPSLDLQLLLYPFIDDRLDTQAFHTNAEAAVFTTADARISWSHYLRGMEGDVPVHAAPARATDLTNLPPAYVVAAGLDCLRDDALDYATGLSRAGGRVELHLLPDVPHGFLSLAPGAGVSRRVMDEVERAVIRAVGRRSDAGRRGRG